MNADGKQIVGVHIQQIYIRHTKVGQRVEIAFKSRPGRIFTGRIEAILKVSSQGQTVISGTVPAAKEVQAEPFFVRIKLDDENRVRDLPAGTVGTAAIYTDASKMTHIIRKVMIRMETYMNYVIPWL